MSEFSLGIERHASATVPRRPNFYRFHDMGFSISLYFSHPTIVFKSISQTRNVFSGITYLMKHLICIICSSQKNDHRTSSIDCDLHKLMNTILCELKNLKDLLSLSQLIIINNILSGVLAIIAFYLTFYVAFFITTYCMV